MVLAIQTPLKQAQKVKQFLLKKGFFNKDYQPERLVTNIYFPLMGLNKTKIKELGNKLDLKIQNKNLKKIIRPKTLAQLLKNKLTLKQIKLIPHTQEIVGSILVLEIPEELKSKEKLIAQAFLEANKNLKTVVKKYHVHRGEYRLRKVRILAGEKTKQTLHKESGVFLRIDLEKTYFSARSANERLRIAKQIKKGEEVLVMFSGAGPFPLVLAKNSPAKKILGIEINPLAHQLALENLHLNKMRGKVTILEGDVRVLLPKIKKKFHRILMPLPKSSELFLHLALAKARPGTIIHFYQFLEEKQISRQGKKIKELCRQYKHQVRILRKVKCGQFSPYVFRVCFDLKVLR